MNERIKELAEQARIYADELLGQGLPDTVWQDRYHEKLVHLVVWECAGICERDKTGHRDSDSVKQGLADMIKQHFGVE